MDNHWSNEQRRTGLEIVRGCLLYRRIMLRSHLTQPSYSERCLGAGDIKSPSVGRLRRQPSSRTERALVNNASRPGGRLAAGSRDGDFISPANVAVCGTVRLRKVSD